MQFRSGQAKGAWLPALHATGGRAAGWIERHDGKFGAAGDVALGPGEMDHWLQIV